MLRSRLAVFARLAYAPGAPTSGGKLAAALSDQIGFAEGRQGGAADSHSPTIFFYTPMTREWPAGRSFASDAAEPCTSCQAPGRAPGALFCGQCGALQPVSRDESFFKLMGMQEGEFKLNDTLLDRQYKNLQRQLHPDKFAGASQAQRELSEDASALVNEAFVTLKHPLKRAEYILEARGVASGEGTLDDPELLQGVMAAREAVDATESDQELQRLAATFQRQAEDCIQGLTSAFSRDDLDRAQELTTLLRYVTRIQAAILDKS